MRARATSIAVVLAVLVAAFFGYQAVAPSNSTYSITADVEQAPNLFEGGRVMVRGVEVGVVTGVVPGPDSVHVTLEIDDDVRIPADASLGIIPITVIADRYVQLFPAYEGGPTLTDGDHIPLERTQIPAELDDVLTQLQGLLSALEPKEGEEHGPLADLIINLDEVVDGKAGNLAAALESSSSVLQNLADSNQDITGLIENLDRLFVALANRSSEIVLVNERLQLVTEALVGDQENLEGTIENLAFFADEASQLIADSGDDLGDAFKNLASVLRRVNAKQGELLTGVRWSNVIAQGLGAVDGSGKGLFAYSGRQAAPGAPGSEYNYRIDTRDTIACNRIDALIQSFLVLSPQATLQQLRDTLMAFFPETYKDDLAYLVDALIPICAEIPGITSTLDAAAQKAVLDLAAQVGEKQLAELLAQWFVKGGGR